MISAPILTLGCCIMIISVIFITLSRRKEIALRTRRRELLENTSAYHVEDYHADTRCDICFDSLVDEIVCDCSCGKTFHRSCAEPTGECPYCGKRFSEFPVKERAAKELTCFRCGKVVERNVCECGTVIPFRDGTFACQCGEELRESSEWCPNCGRTYERRVAFSDKDLFPKG